MAAVLFPGFDKTVCVCVRVCVRLCVRLSIPNQLKPQTAQPERRPNPFACKLKTQQ